MQMSRVYFAKPFRQVCTVQRSNGPALLKLHPLFESDRIFALSVLTRIQVGHDRCNQNFSCINLCVQNRLKESFERKANDYKTKIFLGE